MYSIVTILGHLYFHWNMPGEGEEWLPLIERCLARSPDRDFTVDEAYSIREIMKKKGLNPGAIALMLLQFEDADPTGVCKHELDGYC